MVPSVTCRMCQQKFFANEVSRHGKFCNMKMNEARDQSKKNKSFLLMSSKVIEAMLVVQKEASLAAGSDASYRRNSIISTSSF